MMKLLKIQFLFLGLLLSGAQAATWSNVVFEVDESSYRSFHTNLFVKSGQGRGFTDTSDAAIARVPTAEHDAARDYIFSAFNDMGLEVSLEPFAFTRTYTYTNCNNVIGVLPGLAETNRNIYIIGAHYDSVDGGQFLEESPGADDNASGVAGILEAARVLSQYSFRDTIIFIAFDAEEKGFKGAHHFLENATTLDPAQTNLFYQGDIQGMISLDMIAFNPVGLNVDRARIYGGDPSSQTAVRTNLLNALEEYTDLLIENAGVANASDHAPFYFAGIDACLLIEHEVFDNPHYHTTEDSVDTPDYIDYTYASKLTRSVVGYLTEQAFLVPESELLPVKTVGNESMVIEWSSLAGVEHIVQASDRLLIPDWETLFVCTNLTGEAYMSFTNDMSGTSKRFYRVLSR